MRFEKTCGSSTIVLEAVPMGADLSICIYGGDSPHIGAVTLSIPRASLKDPSKISSSTSVLTVTSHKEDGLAREVGAKLASRLNCRVAVCCGIHFDNAALTDIAAVENTVEELVQEFIGSYLS